MPVWCAADQNLNGDCTVKSMLGHWCTHNSMFGASQCMMGVPDVRHRMLNGALSPL